VFDKRYEFLDEIQEKEIDVLEKRIAARKLTGKQGRRARQKLGLKGNDPGSLEVRQKMFVL